MNSRAVLATILQWPFLNFVLTNCVPRRTLTHIVGRISKSERPWLRSTSTAIWQFFTDVDLSDAATTEFASMHACFTRQLRPGARPIDPHDERLTSPCDAIVGACGAIDGSTLIQAKGQSYTLSELLADEQLAAYYANGCYATLRLTAGMYHRFHAPADCMVRRVRYFSGDTWNVNPPTLQRVSKLFCRNERAVLELELANSAGRIALVPVAAILVASIRLHFLDVTLRLQYAGPHVIACAVNACKGEELGWFEHGSTMIVLAPRGYALANEIRSNQIVRMGQALMTRPSNGES